MDPSLDLPYLSDLPAPEPGAQGCVRSHLYGSRSFNSISRSCLHLCLQPRNPERTLLSWRGVFTRAFRLSFVLRLTGLRRRLRRLPRSLSARRLPSMSADRSLDSSVLRRLHEVTNLKRAGPPRAGPIWPLTTKAPAATGALWALITTEDYVKHSAFSDGTENAADDRCPQLLGGGRRG